MAVFMENVKHLMFVLVKLDGKHTFDIIVFFGSSIYSMSFYEIQRLVSYFESITSKYTYLNNFDILIKVLKTEGKIT